MKRTILGTLAAMAMLGTGCDEIEITAGLGRPLAALVPTFGYTDVVYVEPAYSYVEETYYEEEYYDDGWYWP